MTEQMNRKLLEKVLETSGTMLQGAMESIKKEPRDMDMPRVLVEASKAAALRAIAIALALNATK